MCGGSYGSLLSRDGTRRDLDEFVFGFEGKSSLAKRMLGFQRLFSMELSTLSRQLHEQLLIHLVLYIRFYTVIVVRYRNILQ
jgi:hypothetical protein